jgi:hypothetical protein
MSDHRHERFNLSQMNISMEDIDRRHSQPLKLFKLPNSFDNARLHSTAIHDMGNF